MIIRTAASLALVFGLSNLAYTAPVPEAELTALNQGLQKLMAKVDHGYDGTLSLDGVEKENGLVTELSFAVTASAPVPGSTEAGHAWGSLKLTTLTDSVRAELEAQGVAEFSKEDVAFALGSAHRLKNSLNAKGHYHMSLENATDADEVRFLASLEPVEGFKSLLRFASLIGQLNFESKHHTGDLDHAGDLRHAGDLVVEFNSDKESIAQGRALLTTFTDNLLASDPSSDSLEALTQFYGQGIWDLGMELHTEFFQTDVSSFDPNHDEL